MSRLDDLVASNPVPSWRPAAFLVVALLAAGVAWASVAELEEVATAQGVVVPQGQLKIIQHLEGGIIQSLHVREGDRVTRGQALAQLSLGAQLLNRDEVQAQLDGQMIRRARLTAQAGGTELLFPPEEGARQPEIVQSERRSFEARQRELRSMESRLRIQAQQRGLEVQEFISQRASLARELVNVREKYTISADLLEDGLTTRVEHLGLEQEAEKIRGKLEVIDVAIPRTRSALEEAEERIREARLTSRREANEALAKVDAEIARTRETLSKASDQVDRSVITSPIDGVIKTVFVNTIGGVIGPGQPLMEIVPSGQALVIEAKLSPNDIGFVRVGQRVVVKISTYDFVRYGGLDGVVSEVAPDSSFEDNGDAYFRVRVRTDKTYLGAEPGSLPISAGMLATVDIKTGNKTVAEYLVRPVLKLRHEAFRER